MKIQPLAVAALALVGLSAFAVAEKGKPKAVLYKTPQAVFEASEKARAGDDFDTYVGCFTPKVQAGFVSLYGSILAEGRAEALKKDGDVNKAFAEVLDRHGLTVKAWQKIEKDAGKDFRKIADALEALIKDHPAFLLDAMKLLKRGGFTLREAFEVEKKLTDVKIDDDKAAGVVFVTRTIGDARIRKKYEIKFEKVGGGWRIAEEGFDKEVKDDKKDRK